jgi:hypothetical protein
MMTSRLGAPPSAALAALCLIVGTLGAAALTAYYGPTAFVAVLALGAVVLLLSMVRRAGVLDPWAIALVLLLSANYNLLFNFNSFVTEGVSRARMVTPAATVGLVVFAALQYARLDTSRRRLRLSPVDALFGLLVALATLALVRGIYADNPTVYLVGDYGQILQTTAAYIAIRVYWLNAGNEGMRRFLILLGLSWGIRAAAELAFPTARGTAIIVIEGETLLRRTDPLGPIAVPLLMGLVFSERQRERRLLLAGSLALVAIQNLLGFTRAHYLALGVAVPALMIVALHRPQVRGAALRSLVVAALAVVAAYALFAPFRGAVHYSWDRFLETFEPTTQSRLHRQAETNVVFQYVRAAPLTGYGLGYEYDGVDPETLRGTMVHFVHDDYLALALRGGILLMGAWVAILGYAAWRGFTSPGSLGPLVSAGAAAAVLAEAIAAIPSGSALGYVVGPIIAVAIVVATWRPGEETAPVWPTESLVDYPKVGHTALLEGA